MSGLELLPKAKAARPDVPVIMITAYGDAETKRKALENGAEALLTKPIDFGTSAARSICELSAPRERTGSLMQQIAKSWELRAAMSMARLWRDQGKRAASSRTARSGLWLVH